MPLTDKQIDEMKAFFNQVMNASDDRLGYLWSRWQDEKEYEDFAEYADQMKQLTAPFPALTFLRATQRPFGFVARYAVESFDVDVAFTVSGTSSKWSATPKRRAS